MAEQLSAEQINLMRKAIAILFDYVPSDDQESSRTRHSRQLAALAMENILDQIEVFRACLTQGTPFLEHFKECFQGVHSDDTGAEQILEDMILFFREKALRLPAAQITPIEQRLMRQFEQATANEPDSLVRRWYWFYLPAIVLRDMTQSQALHSGAGADYLQHVTDMNIPC